MGGIIPLLSQNCILVGGVRCIFPSLLGRSDVPPGRPSLPSRAVFEFLLSFLGA
jgi:hypothetical protein